MFFIVIQIFGGVAFAYEFPNALWSVNDKYATAVETKDNHAIIQYGIEILEIVKNEPANEQVTQLRASRMEQIALAYERLGDYPKSAEFFDNYSQFAQQLNWADAVKISKAKVLQYNPQIEVYTASNDVQKNYNARLEPQKGVLFGSTSDGAIRKDIYDESMILLYLEFGDDDLVWTRHIMSIAQEKGIAVEFAWNMPGEGGGIPDVKGQTDYIVRVLDVLNEYKVPVFLRFAAEVNIWGNRADAAQYIEAFRHVSTLAREHMSNVAVVWSVNQVSSWDIDMEDYYPGDAYVDWVGVSLYSQKYFLGRNDWPEEEKFNEIVFLSGDSADPVKALTEVITKYGDRKPIMIAESGASHFVRPLNEDTTNWANIQMQKLYYNVPMVYPQVKLIAHFDKVIDHEINDYALSTSNELAEKYKQLTKLPHFIKGGASSITTYAKLESYIETDKKTLPLYTYAHVFKAQTPKINYYMDDVWISGTDKIPYESSLDLSAYSPGEHTLTVTAESSGAVMATKSYTINIKSNIRLVLNGKEIATDVPPIIKNNRTLVPVRVITEALGANVSWDEGTQTVTILRGSDKIIMQIDNGIMTKNGVQIKLDVPPQIIGARTLVPIRAVSEAMSISVDWDEETQTVLLSS